jgi:hypothetical protein
MGKSHTFKKHSQSYNRSQHGGIKVLLPNFHNPVMEREIQTIQGLHHILSNTRNIEIVSTGSLNSFVFRLHLDPSQNLFRSDTLDTKKSFFSRQPTPLSSAKVENETDGIPIHEIIIKICLIGTPSNRTRLDCFKGRDKAWIEINQLVNEYNTQRYLYSSMMSISGNPFCPDAFGLVTIPSPDITNPRTLINMFRIVPNIQSMLQSDTDLQLVNDYLNKYADRGFQLGVILMESIPSSFKPIHYYSLIDQPHYNKNIYKKLCEGIGAINILSIYRGKMFHLDAHPGNWLCNPKASMVQQIKEIDFGRVYRIDNDANLRHLIQDTKQNIEIYVKNILQRNEYIQKEFINKFYILLGIKDEQLARFSSEQNLDVKINYAQTLFEREIYSLIQLFRTNDYFTQPYISMNADERRMNIKMIHRLILISALIDSFYNCANYAVTQGQISHIYNVILNIAVLSPENILNYPISIDLDEYNIIRHDKATRLKKTYQRIYDIIYKYSGENHFPHIRNYERFKEIYHSRAQRAWIKIKHLGGGIAMCSIAAARGTAICSRAVGNVLSYIPGSSLASRAASSVYDRAVDLKDTVKDKASTAYLKLRSKLSSAHPYQPIPTPSRQRTSSPRARVKIITPLSYGGSIYTRRIKHRKKLHTYTYKNNR